MTHLQVSIVPLVLPTNQFSGQSLDKFFFSGHATKTTHQQQLPGKGRPKRSETLLLRFVVDNKRWRQTQFAPIIVCRPGLQLDYVAMTTEHRISWRSSNCCRGNEQQYVTRRMKQTRCPDIQASIDDASPKRWRVLWRSPQWLAFNFQCKPNDTRWYCTHVVLTVTSAHMTCTFYTVLTYRGRYTWLHNFHRTCTYNLLTSVHMTCTFYTNSAKVNFTEMQTTRGCTCTHVLRSSGSVTTEERTLTEIDGVELRVDVENQLHLERLWLAMKPRHCQHTHTTPQMTSACTSNTT